MKYIFVALLFVACQNISSRDVGLKIATEPLDTIQSAPETITAAPHLFESAFTKNAVQQVNGVNTNLYGSLSAG
jgi:hypothetical protein